MITQKTIVLGAKRSKGTLDNGKAYDSTKLYVQLPMKTSPDTVGYSTDEYLWGDSTNFDKISHLKFPAELDIDFELQTNGKSSYLALLDVKVPLEIKPAKI